MPAPSPEARLLSAQLAAGDPRAIRHVRRKLEEHGGGVTAAADALGVSPATLHRWMAAAGIPGRGRPGPAPSKKDQKST